MFKNIAFVGGIHGVGKSTVCQSICKEINLEYLSASELLKWKEINEDFQNKKVRDISDTQDRLIVGLKKVVKENGNYLLDGHYCLLNSKNEIIDIPIDTFKEISPITINLILGDIRDVKIKLEKRDKRVYEFTLLEQMQRCEENYAKRLSIILGVPLNIGTQRDFSELQLSLRKKFNTE